MRPKKEKVVVPKPKEVPEQNSSNTDANDEPIPLSEMTKKPKEEPNKDCAFLGGELPFVFDHNLMLDAILKINTINFAGNLMLSWGQVKLQLQTRSLDELRKKYNEMNVTLRQIGVDEEKSFIDERILIGERLLAKDY